MYVLLHAGPVLVCAHPHATVCASVCACACARLQVATTSVACGVLGVGGNKGAVGVSMTLFRRWVP